MSVIVTRAVEQVRSAVGSCVEAPLFGLTDAQVGVFRQVSRLHGVLALPLVREADTGGWPGSMTRRRRWRGCGTTCACGPVRRAGCCG